MLVSRCKVGGLVDRAGVLRMQHRFGEESLENEEGNRELDKDRKGVSKDGC